MRFSGLVTSNIPAVISKLGRQHVHFYSRGATMVKHLTQYAHKKMRFYTPRTRRSTGKLRDSIKLAYRFGSPEITGISYVPKSIKYAFAIEYGNTRGDTIRGNPKMAFPASNWKRGSVQRFALNGMFVFSKVTRGKYKGRYFTAKAFKDLQRFYTAKSSAYATQFSKDIMNLINLSGSF